MSKKAAKGKTSGPSRDELTPLQLAFVEAYCHTLNASEAMRRVRQRHDVTRQSAHQLRRHPRVEDEISRRLKERGEYNDQLRREVLETQAAIMRAEIGDVVDLSTQELRSRIPKRAKIALTEINIKEYEGGRSMRIKLADKGVAAERLAKLLGMFEKADPLEQEREQIRDADTTISGRIGGLRARLIRNPEGLGPDGGGAESPAL